jgi:hypothetical protein
VWQALHVELEPLGLTVVTIALDTDVEAARPFDAAASPTHPSLVDAALSMVATFGITNVPFGLWVDESGTIVRPAEVAFAPRPDRSGADGRDQTDAVIRQLPPERQAVVTEMTRALGDTGRYAAAVRDWARLGASSRFVLTPDEVVARSRPRPFEAALAAAEFELGQYLHRTGHGLDATAHFKAAHELDPQNWSYPREAFSLADPSWGKVYDRDLLEEVAAVGPSTFYPPLEL